MNECSSIEVTNMYPNLKDQTTIRLNETNKIKGYFNSEIQERKIMSKLLLLICLARLVLSGTSGGISFISFVGVIGFSCRNSKCNFTPAFFFDYRNNKKAARDNKK